MNLENRTNAKKFQEILQKALEKSDRYDCVYISPEIGMAAIQGYGRLKIKNAFILAQSGSTRQEWEISNFKPLKCLNTFSFCAKNRWNIAVCAGEETDESSYFFFKDMEDRTSIDFFAIGALEMEKCALAFCFDWQNKKNQYLLLDRDEGEDSDLFRIMKVLKELFNRKEDVYETAHTKSEWPIDRV